MWRTRLYPVVASIDKQWLEQFAAFAPAQTIEDVTYTEILRYREKVWRTGTRYAARDALRAIRGLLRYFKARRYPCLSPRQLEKV